jgi:hypothetical protein
MGMSLSVALSGALFVGLGGSAAGWMLSGHGKAANQLHQYQQFFTVSFQTVFLVCAAIAAIGVLISIVRGKGPSTRRDNDLMHSLTEDPIIYKGGERKGPTIK